MELPSGHMELPSGHINFSRADKLFLHFRHDGIFLKADDLRNNCIDILDISSSKDESINCIQFIVDKNISVPSYTLENNIMKVWITEEINRGCFINSEYLSEVVRK